MKIILLILALLFAGCENGVTGVEKAEENRNGEQDIFIQSNGQRYIEQSITFPATGDVVSISFNGATNADTTDYVAFVGVFGDGTDLIDLLNGGDYINGFYFKPIVNQWQTITVRAVLWSDEFPILSNATLKLTDIQVK